MTYADLFEKPKSKKQQLLEWIKQRHYVRTKDVIRWGLENYHIRADRDCRDFAREGLIRRMDKNEKAFRFGCKDDVWVWEGLDK